MKRNLVMFTSEDCTSLIPASVSEFKRHIGDFGPQVKVTVTIENYKRTRSLGQNNLLHKYLTKMGEEIGYDLNEMKDLMKLKFGVMEPVVDKNGNEVYDPETGELQEKQKSTADYKTDEMTVFIDKIRQFSHEVLGCYLPTVEEMKQFNLHW